MRALIIVIALICISGCGLEYYFLLNPPNPIIGSSTDGRFQFSAGAANSEFEFLGFELYYKYYRPGIDPLDISISTFDDLSRKSFRRLNNLFSDKTTSIFKPLFLSSAFKGTNYTVTIDFLPDSGNPTVSATTAPERAITGLRRGVALPAPNNTDFKPFSYYEREDADITTDLYDNYINKVPGQNVTLVFYVLSYGKDPTGLELYSQPIYLGDKLLIFPNITP